MLNVSYVLQQFVRTEHSNLCTKFLHLSSVHRFSRADKRRLERLSVGEGYEIDSAGEVLTESGIQKGQGC